MLLIWNFLENQVEMVRLNINCRETTRKSHPWILDLRVFYCVICFTIFEEHVIDINWLEEEMNRENRLEKEGEAEEQRRRERERRVQQRRQEEIRRERGRRHQRLRRVPGRAAERGRRREMRRGETRREDGVFSGRENRIGKLGA